MQNYANSLVYQDNGMTTGQMSVQANQASLTVTNELGNTHGIVVDTTKTVISGGTTSTSLTLDDSGATLATVATGAPAQLHGVADGTAPNDAVNVKQLTDAIASFTGGGGIGSGEISRLDGRIDRLEGKIKEIAKKAYGGTALSMALAAPTPVQAGQVQMGFGIGNFNGESALALNVSRATETGNAVVSFGGGFTSAGDIGFRGAIAWAWDPEVSSK
jgi:autotransporter adhesin